MSDRLEAAITELVAAIRQELARPDPAAPDRLLDVSESAAALGVAHSTLYTLLDAGSLRSLKVGRRRLVPSSAIEDFIRGAEPI